MHALVVDDEPAVARFLSRSLVLWGWSVDECQSACAARALFESRQYALVVCDVDLPDGDGIDLALAFQATQPSLAIVVASGNPENLERARRCGHSSCLPKPFDLGALKALIPTEFRG